MAVVQVADVKMRADDALSEEETSFPFGPTLEMLAKLKPQEDSRESCLSSLKQYCTAGPAIHLWQQKQVSMYKCLQWWKENGQKQFGPLGNLACKFLSIPATSVAPERFNSVAKLLTRPRRSSLGDFALESFLYINSNFDGVKKVWYKRAERTWFKDKENE